MLDILIILGIISLISAITTAVAKRKHFKRLKASEDPEKLLEVAKHYDNKQKYKDAIEWYEKAAEKGLPEAIYELAMCYDLPKGCGQDKEKAFQLCLKAAEKGLEKAQFRMGNYYENGIGTAQDFVQAMFWYNEAKKNGNHMADNRIEKIKSKLQ